MIRPQPARAGLLRWWELGKSLALVALVLFSLEQSVRLWTAAPPRPVPQAQPVTFPRSDAHTPAPLRQPGRLVWVDGSDGQTGRQWINSGNAVFQAIWENAAALLQRVDPQELAAAPASTLAGGQAPLDAAPRLVLLWNGPAPWGVWYHAVSGQSSADGPVVSRAVIGLRNGVVTLALGDGDTYRDISLPQAFGAWEALKAAVGTTGGQAVLSLTGAQPWSASAPIWVPVSPALGELLVAPEAVPEGTDVPHAFFNDTESVRRIDERGGSVVYTDGRSTLRRGTKGQLLFERGLTGSGEIQFSTSAAIEQAAAFVATHGGWPMLATARVWQVTQRFPSGSLPAPAAGATPGPAPLSIVVQFSEAPQDSGGYPIVGPAGPLAVTVDANGPSSFQRQVPQVLTPSTPRALIAPASALETLNARWSVLYQQQEGQRRIVDMRLIYYDPVQISGRQVLRPAWMVRLAGGDEWAVDALNGQFLGSVLWTP